MSQNRMKLWVGLGACVMVGASGVAAAVEKPAQAGVHAHASGAQSAMIQVAQGGEGGEAGHEHDAFEGMTEDQVLYGQFMLLRGHLKVGSELYAAGRADDAVIHFLHPGEEILPEIGKPLEARGITNFGSELWALANAVQAKKPQAEIAALQKAVLDTVAKAQPTLEPAALAEVIGAVLLTAADEYAVAYEGGSLSNAAEYQDARGFVWTVEEDVAATPKLAFLTDSVAAFKAAWPSAVPPKQPPVPVAEVEATAAALAERCAEVK